MSPFLRSVAATAHVVAESAPGMAFTKRDTDDLHDFISAETQAWVAAEEGADAFARIGVSQAHACAGAPKLPGLIVIMKDEFPDSRFYALDVEGKRGRRISLPRRALKLNWDYAFSVGMRIP